MQVDGNKTNMEKLNTDNDSLTKFYMNCVWNCAYLKTLDLI